MKNYPTLKTNAQEDYKKTFEIYNETITVDNVKRMGELIALSTLRFIALHVGGHFEHIYRSLMKNVFNQKEKEHVISDGYDYAQDAVLFLCKFIGKNPKDTYAIDKNGKRITIWLACAKYVSKRITKDRKRVVNEKTVEIIKHDTEYKTDKQIDEEQKSVEKTIRKMKLNKGQKKTLFCYMAGMTFVQIAKHLSIDLSTVWRHRQQLRQKYLLINSK